MGKSVGPHTIRPRMKVRVLCPPSLSWGVWGEMVCLLGPGVCVILAVCQSGLGNGHQVITPALTASSISLYHLWAPPPPHPRPNTHYLFHSLLQRSRRKKKNDWVAGHHKTQQRYLKSQWDYPAPLHSVCSTQNDVLEQKTREFHQVRS